MILPPPISDKERWEEEEEKWGCVCFRIQVMVWCCGYNLTWCVGSFIENEYDLYYHTLIFVHDDNDTVSLFSLPSTTNTDYGLHPAALFLKHQRLETPFPPTFHIKRPPDKGIVCVHTTEVLYGANRKRSDGWLEASSIDLRGEWRKVFYYYYYYYYHYYHSLPPLLLLLLNARIIINSKGNKLIPS